MLAQLIDIGSRLLLSAVSMKENKGTNIIVYLVAGIVGMSILVSYIVSTHSVPTFSEYVQKTSDYTGLTTGIPARVGQREEVAPEPKATK